MKKYLYLLKNIGLLTVSKFGSKILSFALVPLYTNLLSAEEYGTFDLYYTTVCLALPLLTWQIVEGVLRFSLDGNEDSQKVFSVGLKRILVSCVVVCGLTIVNRVLIIVPVLVKYGVYLNLMIISEMFYSLFSQFSRGQDRLVAYAIAGVINSFVLFSSNILFLWYFKIGIDGYFLSFVLANFVPCIYLFVCNKIWRYVNFSIDKSLSKKMYSYSVPLVLNNLAWWINNASDRYIVTLICGTTANGIYSIAYKIPSLLNTFQEIFSQAWTLSAIKEYKGKDNSRFYTRIYEIYNLGMVITCSILIVLDKLLARLLFANEFYEAWRYAPFLMISVVFGSLAGMFGGIFSAAKKSKVFAQTTMYGACVNTILNIFLVKVCGPLGAAISTLISYFLVWMARYNETRKIVNFEINIKRDISSYSCLLIQAVILMIDVNTIHSYMIEIMLLLVILVLYRHDIFYYIGYVRKGR